ncbi:SMI1/KNR4 family protein [Streptomyces roseifaciens]|uniref:SMI1/KNR4 family protein n=1 Tax=Streptomyces roseifaciens TaxID=1488406 RepID=UPI0013662798|nr:SMI1/KNR4 family protein [Streptomyces roseifaciens]
MWRKAAGQTFPEAEFRDPVTTARLAAAEQQLGCGLPTELASLLQETDGIAGHYGVDTVWP